MAGKWDEHGVWCEKLESHEETGRWLVGDRIADDHPGHMPDKTHVMFKVWRAVPGTRYDGDAKSGGHVRELPAHGGGVIEFVHVLSGRFYFMGADGSQELLCQRSKESPDVNDGKILLSTDPGRWYLGKSRFASGVTICRPGYRKPMLFGAGDRYDYRILDTDFDEGEDWTRILSAFVEEYRYKLIVVFEGTVWHQDSGAQLHRLDPLTWAYTRPDSVRGQWYPDGDDRTVVVVLTY